MADQTTTVAGTDTPPPSTPDRPEQLTGEQYRMELDILAATFRAVEFINIDALRDFHSSASTLGPMLDPTAYMRGGATNLDDQADLIEAAAEVRRRIDRIKARHPELTR